MATVNIHIRDIDETIYKRIRIKAIEQGVAVGEVINAAMAEYLARFDARARQVASEAEQDA